MKTTLYEIEQTYINIVEQLMNDECTPELEESLAIAEKDLQTKGIAYANVIKQMDSECDIIDAEIERLTKLKKARVNASERLKERIKQAMILFSKDEIKTPLIKLSFRKSEAVIVHDVNSLPQMFKTIKITEQPDKVKIKETLKQGEDIIGCEIVTNLNLQIK
jgi:hypothetical protein